MGGYSFWNQAGWFPTVFLSGDTMTSPVRNTWCTGKEFFRPQSLRWAYASEDEFFSCVDSARLFYEVVCPTSHSFSIEWQLSSLFMPYFLLPAWWVWDGISSWFLFVLPLLLMNLSIFFIVYWAFLFSPLWTWYRYLCLTFCWVVCSLFLKCTDFKCILSVFFSCFLMQTFFTVCDLSFTVFMAYYDFNDLELISLFVSYWRNSSFPWTQENILTVSF